MGKVKSVASQLGRLRRQRELCLSTFPSIATDAAAVMLQISSTFAQARP